MKASVSFAAAAMLVVCAEVDAQDENESEVALLDSAAQAISPDELETFADIYVDLEKVAGKYEMEIATAESEQEARSLQARMQRESLEKIERRGWTEEKYEKISETINANPELLERALALIDERS